jgi:alanine racemase
VIAMDESFFSSQPSPGEIENRVEGYASWLEVDLDLLDHNLDRVREWTGVEIVPCVKSNAYGHGVVPVVAAMMRWGVRRVLVAKLWEAMQIRGAGLDCGVVSVDPLYSGRQYGEVVEESITQAVFSRSVAERLSRETVRQGRDAEVWVKVDTGLGRVGVRHDAAAELIAEVASMPGLEVSGVFSTLSEDRELDRVQLGRLLEVGEELKRRGVDVPCMSLGSSNAVFHFPEAYLDAVRPGLMLYGLYPEPEDRGVGLELRPVMSFKARLEQVKLVEEGESLTYSRRFVVPRRMVVGTVHAGYSDGVPRAGAGPGGARVEVDPGDGLGEPPPSGCGRAGGGCRGRRGGRLQGGREQSREAVGAGGDHAVQLLRRAEPLDAEGLPARREAGGAERAPSAALGSAS